MQCRSAAEWERVTFNIVDDVRCPYGYAGAGAGNPLTRAVTSPDAEWVQLPSYMQGGYGYCGENVKRRPVDLSSRPISREQHGSGHLH